MKAARILKLSRGSGHHVCRLCAGSVASSRSERPRVDGGPFRKPEARRPENKTWATRISTPLQEAAVAAAHEVERPQLLVARDTPEETGQPTERSPRVPSRRGTGAFQVVPVVPGAEEHLNSALKRAGRVTGNKALKNRLHYARNLAARRLDKLTQELATPLGRLLREFPGSSRLHPFEEALLDLTIGKESYQKRLERLDTLRKSCLEVGKSLAGQAAKAPSAKEAFAILDEGFARLEALYRKGSTSVDSVKDIAKNLRKLPTVNPALPTVALVGAPNVGKSSLVQILSSGLPEICDYPFTTRTVKMGHFFVEGSRHQVTDTPGLLDRPEEDRNAMERLTLACLEHLPTAVLFVMDLTGECGTSVAKQWRIRANLRQRFGTKPWVDVFSKSDLLGPLLAELQAKHDGVSDGDVPSRPDSEDEMTASEIALRLGDAKWISSMEHTGLEELKEAMMSMLSVR